MLETYRGIGLQVGGVVVAADRQEAPFLRETAIGPHGVGCPPCSHGYVVVDGLMSACRNTPRLTLVLALGHAMAQKLLLVTWSI